MSIDPKDEFAGLPAIKVRDFLRRHKDRLWSLDIARGYFHISTNVAKQLVEMLLSQGYVEPSERLAGTQHWNTTTKGNALANASAAPRIKRETATKNLAAFLCRVREANTNPDFAFRVARVEVFGSYLGSGERLGDLDLALTVVPRQSAQAAQRNLEQSRIDAAFKRGRSFRTILDELDWPRQELLLFLKARSRVINFTPATDTAIGERKTVFEEG